ALVYKFFIYFIKSMSKAMILKENLIPYSDIENLYEFNDRFYPVGKGLCGRGSACHIVLTFYVQNRHRHQTACRTKNVFTWKCIVRSNYWDVNWSVPRKIVSVWRNVWP